MSSNGVIYEYNKSSVNDLFIHLYAVDNDYAVRLSDRTDIKEYAQKLFEKSERIEAWENDVLVGLVAYYNNQVTNSVYVSDVSVKKKFRSYGIASNLLNRLKDNVIKNNITKIVLEADDSLGDFYVKNGFTIGKRISDRSHEMEYYKDDKDIMVSICCLVYNHEPYLRQCFDGFVMQQTTFPIEILVHDDASTDHSADIIQEYTEKYPDLFKPIYQTENQYSKGVKITMTYQIPRAKGKYIAMCEGDDYWTDPLKLQKQVDFLEEHEDYVMCCHRYKLFFQESGTFENDYVQDLFDVNPEGFTFGHKETVMRLISHTSTVVYRNNLIDNSELKRTYRYCKDVHLVYHLLLKGKGYYFPFYASVYRKHNGGVWSRLNTPQTYKMYHLVYQEILDKNPNDDDLKAKVLSIIKSDLHTRARVPQWTYVWIRTYLRAVRKSDGIFCASRKGLLFFILYIYHIVKYLHNKIRSMRLIAYLKNQLLHDRNTRQMLTSNSAEISRLQKSLMQAQESLILRKVDWLKEKVMSCTEMGVTAEKICNEEVIVSLTSFGKRINEVYLAIESIMQGTVKPNKIVLWLAEDEFKGRRLPQTLMRQQKRGLQIEYCEDIRSYLKIVPTIEKYPNACVVTIDDDVMYEFDLLENLINAHIANPEDVCACRIHRITLDGKKSPKSYMQWQWEVWPQDKSNLNFLTGVGGCLYPPNCFINEFFNRNVFMSLSPFADDVWINAMLLMSGRQITKTYTHSKKGNDYIQIHIEQDDALSSKNKYQNDVQIKSVFEKYGLYEKLY